MRRKSLPQEPETNHRNFFKFNPRSITHLVAESPSAGGKATFKGKCKIGAFSYVGMGSAVASASIGRYCSIAPGVTIGPAEHRIDQFSTHPFASGYKGPFSECDEYKDIAATPVGKASKQTVIGNDVWIGQNAVIRQGVKVGDGAVIAAQAVVSKDVAPYTIVGGVPAKQIRMRFSEDVIARMLKLKWWEYDLAPLKGKIDFNCVEAALDMLERMSEAGNLMRATPYSKIIGRDVIAG